MRTFAEAMLCLRRLSSVETPICIVVLASYFQQLVGLLFCHLRVYHVLDNFGIRVGWSLWRWSGYNRFAIDRRHVVASYGGSQ